MSDEDGKNRSGGNMAIVRPVVGVFVSVSICASERSSPCDEGRATGYPVENALLFPPTREEAPECLTEIHVTQRVTDGIYGAVDVT